MKVVNIGREYMIYDDSLRTHDELPAQLYCLRFSNMKGFYLEAQDGIEIKEEKIYGVHNEKIHKVLSSFERSNRNLGVILSGHKGIGKSLFAKLLSKTAIDNNYPVILIDRALSGLSAFLEDIKQEVVVLFDEFDKIFAHSKSGDAESNPQDTLLSLFDGMSNGKKLFIVTCNSLHGLSDYIINRPGRFHYHFRFDFPSDSEIEEYMKDKLSEKYYGEIEKVKQFASKVNLNYDCLRAIAFELNAGLSFEEAIRDLNIMNMNESVYSLTLYFEDGTVLKNKRARMDMFDRESTVDVYFDDGAKDDVVCATFNPGDFQFNFTLGANYLPGDKISHKSTSLFYSDEVSEKYDSLVPKYMIATREKGKDLHYMLV